MPLVYIKVLSEHLAHQTYFGNNVDANCFYMQNKSLDQVFDNQNTCWGKAIGKVLKRHAHTNAYLKKITKL
jgi:hypothetical protein